GRKATRGIRYRLKAQDRLNDRDGSPGNVTRTTGTLENTARRRGETRPTATTTTGRGSAMAAAPTSSKTRVDHLLPLAALSIEGSQRGWSAPTAHQRASSVRITVRS